MSRDTETRPELINYSVVTRSTEADVVKEFELLGRISSECDGKIIKDENEEVIRVKISSYTQLVRICGGWWTLVWGNIFMIGFVYFKFMTDFTCGKWAAD